MSFEKRTYETRAVRELRERLNAHTKVLAVGPTGCGKTVIASMLIRDALKTKRWRRGVFLAHRYELVDQAYKRLTDAGVECGVLMAQEESLRGTERVDPGARVQVASVQTITRRGVPGAVDFIVFDEAHRVMADSYQEIAAACSGAQILGLTATPCRQDGRGLGSFFSDMYEIAKPSALYETGYLAKPRTFAAPPETIKKLIEQLKKVRSVHGDYDQGQLARSVDNQLLVGNIVSESIRLAPKVPKVVFAAGVEHSKRIAKRFLKRGIKAAHVDGETHPDERQRILSSLASGRIEVVCNVDVLSEGWDLPALGAVIIARPTKSLARFLQMCGRVQRKYGNRVPLILDHGNNVLRHQVLPSEDVQWTLDETVKHGGKSDPIFRACHECYTFAPTATRVCPECGAEREIDERERKMQEEAVRLEELRRDQIDKLHARAQNIAARIGAPSNWVNAVVGSALA